MNNYEIRNKEQCLEVLNELIEDCLKSEDKIKLEALKMLIENTDIKE